MLRIAKTLIAATALAMLPATQSFAEDWTNSSSSSSSDSSSSWASDSSSASDSSGSYSSSNSGETNYTSDYGHDDYGRPDVEGAGSYVVNGQVNLNTVWTNLNADVDGVEGDVVGSAVAVGNAFDSTTMRNTWVVTDQYQSGSGVGTHATVGISNVGGSVGFTAQAVCNQANVSTDPTITDVKNTQVCDAEDPSAELYANVSNVVGDVSLATSAVGNTFQTDTNAQIAPVVNTQVNHSVVAATSNVKIQNVGGSVGINASAIGNTATVVHY